MMIVFNSHDSIEKEAVCPQAILGVHHVIFSISIW